MVWLCLGVAGRKRDPGHGQLWCSWAAPSLSQHSTSSPGELSPGIYLEWRKNRHTESNGMLVSFSSTTNGHHHSIGVIENLVLLCWGSCTTRAKRSVSRIWKSNPKLSDMRTWEQENEDVNRSMLDVCHTQWCPTDLFERFADHLGDGVWKLDLPRGHRGQDGFRGYHTLCPTVKMVGFVIDILTVIFSFFFR